MSAECKRCASYKRPDVPAVLVTYWGDPLCEPCATHVAQLLDERDAWPAVPWSDDEIDLFAEEADQ